MNGSSRFIVTVTDGRTYSCMLFSKETATKLHRACKAFTFDTVPHYRLNRRMLRRRMDELLSEDPQNESLRRLCSFLGASPHNRCFAVTGGDIAGSRLFLQIQRTLAVHNRETIPPDNEPKLRLLSMYDFTSAGMVVRKSGQAVKSRRKCRYCGRMVPATTFDSKAHTISEALGNKTLYTNDECDLCNNGFCKGIETQFINRLSPFFPVLGVAGKNGGRKVTGKNYSLYRTGNMQKPLPLTVNFSDRSVKEKGSGCATDIEIRSWSPNRAWAPQNIYRFLCKFVIGTIDTRLLRYFRRTIEWINGASFREKLPKVCIENLGHTIRQPIIYIYRRQKNRNFNPYLFARIHLFNCAYTFIIPFCSLDVPGLNHDRFLMEATGLVPSLQREWADLNRMSKIVPEVVAYFASGDHNILCDMDENTSGIWYPEEQQETPQESADDMVYDPVTIERTAV